MDATTLGKLKLLGCPFHGLVVDNRLTLPNSAHIDGKFSADLSRGSLRLSVPGVPAVSRTVDEAAYDATQGWQWRNDLAITVDGNDRRMMLYGAIPVNGQSIYCVAPGKCWAVALPFSMSYNAGKTALDNDCDFTPVGTFYRAGAAPAAVPVAVSMTGYDAMVSASEPVSNPVLLDILPDGSAAILGAVVFDSRHDKYTTDDTSGVDLLRISGDGAVTPFAAVLENLADVVSGVEYEDDGFEEYAGCLEWTAAISTAMIPPVTGSDPCEWFEMTVNGSELTVNPSGIDSANTPRIVSTVGTRTATLTDRAVGYWFGADGSPESVTLDLDYEHVSTRDISGAATAIAERVVITEYYASGGACVESGGYVEDEGSYTFTGTDVSESKETLTITLKVGGVTLDSVTLEYSDVITQTLSGTSPGYPDAGYLKPSTGTSADSTRLRRLYKNATLIDEVYDGDYGSGDGELFATGNFVPSRAVDEDNRFSSIYYDVRQWLPQVATSLISLPDDVRSIAVQTVPHWWSTRLVCLLQYTFTAPFSESERSAVYGVTAYPGGVTGSTISVAAPFSPRYGALNPFGGAPLLGQTDKINYV